MDLASVVGSGIFALFGSVLGIYLRSRYDWQASEKAFRRDRSESAKVVADSLRGEVKTTRALIKIARDHLDNTDESREREDVVEDLRMFAEAKPIVNSESLAKVGFLWNRLSRETLEYFGDFNVAQLYAKRLICLGDSNEFSSRLDRMKLELNSLAEEATMLAERLNQFSMGLPYPGRRDKRIRHLYDMSK